MRFGLSCFLAFLPNALQKSLTNLSSTRSISTSYPYMLGTQRKTPLTPTM
jgi:hypothetical protein